MVRVKRGITSHYKHKKILKLAKGYYGARSRCFRVAKQSVIKAHQYSYRDRRQKKRKFRELWILKINAAVRNYGINYSKFIYILHKLKIKINRKFLAFFVVNQPKTFESLLSKVLKKIYL